MIILDYKSKTVYSQVSNRRREGRINGEADKNKAIRNFIEIKSSNNLVKISTKRT